MIGCHSVIANKRQQKKRRVEREKKRLYSPGAAVFTSLATDCACVCVCVCVFGGGGVGRYPANDRKRYKGRGKRSRI